MEEQGLPLATSFGQDACSGRTVARVVEAAPKLQGAGVREVEEAVDTLHYWLLANTLVLSYARFYHSARACLHAIW